jgi:predicted oxidoreductase
MSGSKLKIYVVRSPRSSDDELAAVLHRGINRWATEQETEELVRKLGDFAGVSEWPSDAIEREVRLSDVIRTARLESTKFVTIYKGIRAVMIIYGPGKGPEVADV